MRCIAPVRILAPTSGRFDPSFNVLGDLEMNPSDALNWRYAVKKFSDEKITPQALEQLLRVARLSASSYGLQPYKIIVVESRELRQKLVPFSMGQDKVVNSSHLIVFAAQAQPGDSTVDAYIDAYSRTTQEALGDLVKLSAHLKSVLRAMPAEERQVWAHQQAFIALGTFLTCAALMRIDSCPMGGFDAEGYDAVLALDKMGLTTTVICPVGRRHPEDQQALAPKVRMDYHDLVMER